MLIRSRHLGRDLANAGGFTQQAVGFREVMVPMPLAAGQGLLQLMDRGHEKSLRLLQCVACRGVPRSARAGAFLRLSDLRLRGILIARGSVLLLPRALLAILLLIRLLSELRLKWLLPVLLLRRFIRLPIFVFQRMAAILFLSNQPVQVGFQPGEFVQLSAKFVAVHFFLAMLFFLLVGHRILVPGMLIFLLVGNRILVPGMLRGGRGIGRWVRAGLVGGGVRIACFFGRRVRFGIRVSASVARVGKADAAGEAERQRDGARKVCVCTWTVPPDGAGREGLNRDEV